MKKTKISILALALLFTAGLQAQTVQEGKSHFFAERFGSAILTFDKLVATDPNNTEAIYWLGQSYLQSEEIMSARIAKTRELYTKAMQTSNGAPLIMVGMGHLDMLENKADDARQKFETALTATRTRKGDAPDILNAVARAVTDAKTTDYNYAITKLQEALDNRNVKDPEMAVLLGNAIRKARPGEGGGEAFRYYKKALDFNSNFPLASFRLAKLFQSQKNWELVYQYLTETIQKDDKFSAAYYELFYYYFERLDFETAEQQLQKYINSKLPEQDIQDQYLYAQLCWAKKNFKCATEKAVEVTKALGDNTKPKVYRLLADAYFTNGEFYEAKKYSNRFFEKKNPEDLTLYDYQLRADILDKTGGTVDEVFDTYLQGMQIDTTLTLKLDFLKKGSEKFKARKDSIGYEKQGALLVQLLRMKETPSMRDYFDAGFAFYQSENYPLADSVFDVFIEKYPDEIYGPMMQYNIHRAIDTTMELGAAVPWAEKYLVMLEKDTSKNKKTIIGVAGYLAQYNANIVKDINKAIEYLQKMLDLDPENEALQKTMESLKKAAGTAPKPAGTGVQPGKNGPVARVFSPGSPGKIPRVV